MKKTTLLALLGTTLISTAGLAVTQKIDLDMHGAHLRGSSDIKLKRMIRTQLGPRLTRGFTLKKVEVQIKSKHGNGQVSLLVGHNESLSKSIPGTEENFDSPSSGYTNLTLRAPHSYRGQGQQGPMKLLVDGNVKVNDIQLTMERQLQYNHTNINGIPMVMVKEFKAQKVIGSTKTIRLNKTIDAIALQGTKGKVRITEVKINYMDGQTLILDELEGKVKNGQVKTLRLKRELLKPIKNLQVSATTTSLFGSRGKLAIKISQ